MKSIKLVLISVLLLSLAPSLSAEELVRKDLRAVKIEKFLAQYYPDSPLRNKSHEIIYCADKFGLDYRLYLAIAAAESGLGKHYPKHNSNLTGINNGDTKFSSIYDNIFGTHKLIATGKWYKKYRQTKKLEDLVYVFKGVPPYEHYLKNMRVVIYRIGAIPIEDEVREDSLFAWNTQRYDQTK